MNVLGIDPGGSTGLALIRVEDKVAKLVHVQKSKDPTLKDARKLFEEADVIVCEDWKTRPAKAKQGAFNYSSMPTARMIGAIEVLSEGKMFVLQQAAIKPVGYGFANLHEKYKKVPKSEEHVLDAIAHAMYYLVSRKLARPL